MRIGIRPQVALALAGLLVAAFAPLFFASASLTQATLEGVRASAALAEGRAIGRHVQEARRDEGRGEAALREALDEEIRAGAAAAIVVYDAAGAPLARGGEVAALRAFPSAVAKDAVAVDVASTAPSKLAVVTVSGARGAVVVAVRTDVERGRAAPLVRLVGLYTATVAVALLVFAYFAITRLVVRPIDAISGAARRVAEGARTLDVPREGGRELVELGESLAAMTAKLRADEERMRQQIDELEQRAHELRDAQASLVRSERLASVGRLAAGLAHEIGNPIAALLGIEELLLEGAVDDSERDDFVRRMRVETERVHRILRDLLDFARPASPALGASSIEAPGDLVLAARAVAALVRPQRTFRDVELSLALPDEPVVTTLAEERAVQVMLNLVMNAADAVVGKGHVTLSVAREGERATLVVEDDGPGVAPTVASRLFEPFATTKEVGRGTGLGLAVCRGLVEAAGGTIRVDEAHAPGARFVVELPTARAGAAS